MIYRLMMALLVGSMWATAPVHAFDLNAMTDEERATFREEIRAYLMDNPEVILEAVNSLEARQAAQQAQADFDLVAQNVDELFNDGFSFVGGNPDGDVTMVEFLDYRCGFCKRAFGDVERLLEEDGNIRFVVKEFPILGEQSLLASRYAIATRMVEGGAKYKSLHDALMVFNGDISLPSLRRLAKTLDLDSDAIEARMDDSAIADELRANRALAQRLQITGTPTFVLEDEMLRGFLPFEQMRQLVDEKRG